MNTIRSGIEDAQGNLIPKSKALLWGNNASWVGLVDGELYGNRTGDSEYLVESPAEKIIYEIRRGLNKNGNQDLGPAVGVRALNYVQGRVVSYKRIGRTVVVAER